MYAIAEDTLPARVLKELLLYRRRYPEHRQSASEADEIRRIEQVQLPRIAAFIEAGEPIEFVLPAFPAKSPNPGKVLDSRPDMAERLSLSFLNHLCQRIQLFYAPGAKITVCSDGRVFGDLVRIGDAHISAYQDALRLMIEEIGATHIGVFNLEDVRAFEAQRDNHEQLRQLLIDGYAEPLESIRETLLASEEGLLLYRAITRFLYEDGLTPDYQGSKTALQRDAKERAYGVIQRSWAWGALLADQFPPRDPPVHPSAAGGQSEVRHPHDADPRRLADALARRGGEHRGPLRADEAQRGAGTRRRTGADQRPAQSLPPAGQGRPARRRGLSPRSQTMNAYLSDQPVRLSPLRDEQGNQPRFGLLLEPGRPGMHVGELPAQWLKGLARSHHLLLLRGFAAFADAESLTRYCHDFGEVMLWPFGAVLELVEQEGAEDHIFANNYVPLHWDGMYLETVPEFQLFHCVDAPGDSDGGRTTFSSTPAALQLADSSELELWRRASGRYQRSAAHYSSRSAAPIVERHPRREFPILRFCEPPVEGDASFINPSEFHYDGIAPEQRGELLASLRRCLYHPQAHYAHRWRSDDLVIADNLTLLHGREAFVHRAPRHLRRVHIHAEPALRNPHLQRD